MRSNVGKPCFGPPSQNWDIYIMLFTEVKATIWYNFNPY